ncbi:MAG: transcription-repair coupling factor [Bacilli bacterium]|nr:transcription-repair coupling factor [Bacilli bacterium]
MENIFQLFKIDDIKNVSGLTDELNILYIYNYFIKKKQNIIVLTSSLFEATKYFEKLQTYTDQVYFFPMDEFLTSVAIAVSPEFKNNRLETLQAIANNNSSIVVTNLMGFLRFLPNKKLVEKSFIKLKKKESIIRSSLEKILYEFGYNKVSLVTSTGEYSIRGYVIDIFPLDSEKPVRIELFGNLIENIKIFEPDSQLSIGSIENVLIVPYKELISTENESLYSFLKKPVVFTIEKKLIDQSYKQLKTEILEYNLKKETPNKKHMFNKEDISLKEEINIGEFGLNVQKTLCLNSSNIENFQGNLDKLKTFVLDRIPKYTIVFMLSKDRMIKEISELFSYNVNIGQTNLGKINIIKQKINNGFILNNTIYIGEFDIELVTNTAVYKPAFKIGKKIKNFSDINKGDYVVHIYNGIGIYKGIVTLTTKGFKKDYIQINYLDNDKVYIPVEKIETIYKYSDKEGTKPKIHKLGSSSWGKTKLAVRNKIKDISEDLINLYAERAKSKTTPYLPFVEEEKFKSEFEFTETVDQSKCIAELLIDLETTIPTDRLLCGDVGFGKTEVSFRGIFRAVLNGFQVAYLCPTTILSKQQYLCALKRFKDYGINIALLNRFVTPKDTEKIIEGLKSGAIDIVFGTHKLLNEKIKYKNLGFLIIDEEQRFGVTHKEKIKSMKKNINILTLSATPIPRTLKMAMSGLKDLSILDTPPQNRYPIQTYVIEEADLLIKDAIYKELSRKGQIYFLYNNVVNIESRVAKLKLLVPDARIGYAHGQLPKNKLESIIEDFIEYKYDILVCSTIIETGIDISNVNTLIVIDAQNYGLSQLYQLRGRVGRGNKVAYAYLMYNPAKTLTETAVKRLKAIKEFTELGSGYKIALRDLSIRGAGDILGSEQAGFIDSVGINLYTQMVEETMNEIKGKQQEEVNENLSLIDVDTHIPENYVSDENIRIEIHQLINQVKDLKSLNQVKYELEDRFGILPDKIIIYMYEEWFENLCNTLKITEVVQNDLQITITLPKDISDQINGEKLFLQTYNIHPKFKLKYLQNKISLSLPLKNLEKHYIYYLVELIEIINSHIV